MGIRIENAGFRIKPGMTIKVKGLLTQYTEEETKLKTFVEKTSADGLSLKGKKKLLLSRLNGSLKQSY